MEWKVRDANNRPAEHEAMLRVVAGVEAEHGV
jgi:hypothetical protein